MDFLWDERLLAGRGRVRLRGGWTLGISQRGRNWIEIRAAQRRESKALPNVRRLLARSAEFPGAELTSALLSGSVLREVSAVEQGWDLEAT